MYHVADDTQPVQFGSEGRVLGNRYDITIVLGLFIFSFFFQKKKCQPVNNCSSIQNVENLLNSITACVPCKKRGEKKSKKRI